MHPHSCYIIGVNHEMGLDTRKPVFGGLRRLISAFVIHLLESIIYRLAAGEISTFYLVSAAEQPGLNLDLSETPKTGYLATRPR